MKTKVNEKVPKKEKDTPKKPKPASRIEEEKAEEKILVLRVVLMNPFITRQSLQKCYLKIKEIAMAAAQEDAKLADKLEFSHSLALEDIPEETEKPHSFDEYFVTPLNAHFMKRLAHIFVDMVTRPARNKATLPVPCEKLFGDNTLPQEPATFDEVVRELYQLYKASVSTDTPPVHFTATLGAVISQTLNPNNIGQEVSPASTAAEVRLIDFLTEMIGYREYERKLPNGNFETIKPGGIITNGMSTSLLTVLLVARNVRMRELLSDPEADVTEIGIARAWTKLKKKFDKCVIITSESQAELIRELSSVIGMGRDKVVVVKEENGNTDPDELKATIKNVLEKKDKILFINICIADPVSAKAKDLQHILQPEVLHNWVNITLKEKAGASLLSGSVESKILTPLLNMGNLSKSDKEITYPSVDFDSTINDTHAYPSENDNEKDDDKDDDKDKAKKALSIIAKPITTTSPQALTSSDATSGFIADTNVATANSTSMELDRPIEGVGSLVAKSNDLLSAKTTRLTMPKVPHKNSGLSSANSEEADKKGKLKKIDLVASPHISCILDAQDIFSMPHGIGMALFKNGLILETYLKQSAPYVIKEGEGKKGELVDIGGYSVEGSKGFQALELWLTLLFKGRSATLKVPQAIDKNDKYDKALSVPLDEHGAKTCVFTSSREIGSLKMHAADNAYVASEIEGNIQRGWISTLTEEATIACQIAQLSTTKDILHEVYMPEIAMQVTVDTTKLGICEETESPMVFKYDKETNTAFVHPYFFNLPELQRLKVLYKGFATHFATGTSNAVSTDNEVATTGGKKPAKKSTAIKASLLPYIEKQIQEIDFLSLDLASTRLRQDVLYRIKYDNSRLTPSQVQVVKAYAKLLQTRIGRPKSVKLEPFSSAAGSKESLFAVYCSSNASAAKPFKGEGHVDVALPEGGIKDYILHIPAMLNIAVASASIPSGLSETDLDSYKPLLSYISAQYKFISGGLLPIPDSAEAVLQMLRNIILLLPRSDRVDLDTIDEYNRLALQALESA